MHKNLDQLQALQTKVLELMTEIAQLKISLEKNKFSEQMTIGKPKFSQMLSEQQMHNKLFKALSKGFRNGLLR